jgi:hypothetical protein
MWMVTSLIAITSSALTKTHGHDRKHLIFRAVGHAALRHPEVMKNGRFGQDRECRRLIFMAAKIASRVKKRRTRTTYPADK